MHNISQLCRFAGHAYILSPMVTVTRVAKNHQLSSEMNEIVSFCCYVLLVVWTGLTVNVTTLLHYAFVGRAVLILSLFLPFSFLILANKLAYTHKGWRSSPCGPEHLTASRTPPRRIVDHLTASTLCTQSHLSTAGWPATGRQMCFWHTPAFRWVRSAICESWLKLSGSSDRLKM